MKLIGVWRLECIAESAAGHKCPPASVLQTVLSLHDPSVFHSFRPRVYAETDRSPSAATLLATVEFVQSTAAACTMKTVAAHTQTSSAHSFVPYVIVQCE